MAGKLLLTGFAIALLCAPVLVMADIYQWEDARGVVHFTDDIKKSQPVQGQGASAKDHCSRR